MTSSSLKQTELFALIAMIFIIIAGGTVAGKSSSSDRKASSSSLYPSIIEIPGDAINFETGKAVPAEGIEKLRAYLKNQVIPEIEKTLSNNEKLDMIEVVGHTDTTRVQNSKGNLDDLLSKVANGVNSSSNLSTLSPASNTDLGLMRALVVLKIIKEFKESDECKCMMKDRIKAIRAYSAAQLFTSNGKEFAPFSEESDPKRRRFEIRLTKWVEKTKIKSAKP